MSFDTPAENKAFAEANPAAAKLFEVMQLPVADINAQNLRMSRGEDKAADIERHVDGWIKAHQKTFDGWVAEALPLLHPVRFARSAFAGELGWQMLFDVAYVLVVSAALLAFARRTIHRRLTA